MLAFNESRLAVIAQTHPIGTRRAPFVWSDIEDIESAAWMQRNGIHVTTHTTNQAILATTRKRSFHPIRDYLNALAWDSIPRIDDWMLRYLGCDNSACTRAVGAKWLIGAAARIFQPGSKNDSCLILEGEQGTKKSTALRILAGEWFSDDMPELGSKDAALNTRGVWIIGLSELDAMTAADVSRIKAFMSRAVGLRPPYGRHPIDAPHECVFAGTSNHDVYLKDETGDRRFWPVRCGPNIDVQSLLRDRDQLWAEAVHRYRKR